MKYALILSAAMLGLAACNSGSGPDGEDTKADAPEEATTTETAEAGFRADCLTIANDSEGQEQIAGMGTDADGFCDCAEKFIAAMPEDDQAQAKATMSAVADGMNESGAETETVVGQMMGEAMAKGDGDAEAQATINGVKLVGSMIDDISDTYDENGSCEVS